MPNFEGTRSLAVPLAVANAKLRDLAFLTSCVPDAELLAVGAGEVKFRVLPGFSFARGALDVTLQQVASADDQPIAYRFLNKGLGSGSEVETSMALESEGDAGTLVRWRAEVKNLTGLLKMVPPGLIKAAAQKVIHDVWTEVDKRLANG